MAAGLDNCGLQLLAVHAWASQVQALSSGLQSRPWHCTRLSQWALPIKRWRHCLFSTPLGSTQRFPCSTFEDQLQRSCICSRRTSVMEQTTSNNPLISHSSEFHEPIESSLLLMDHFFFFFVHLEHKHPRIGLHVTAPKKLTLYYLQRAPPCIKNINATKSRTKKKKPSKQ